MRSVFFALFFIGLAVAIVPRLVKTKITESADQVRILKDKMMAVNMEHIEAVNSNKDAGWRAGVNSQFVGWTIGDVKHLMGARWEGVKGMPKQVYYSEKTGKGSNPKNFDWRTAAPECVGAVLDQGHCGSCWAFGAAESLSDRFCIHSNATVKVALSEQNIVSCDSNDGGCDGGDLSSAWDYMKNNGVVTQACSPYLSAGCNPTPCLPPFQNTPPCNRTCANNANYQNDKHYAASAYSVGGWYDRVSDIETEIMKNGPVEAAFSVYQDFLNYKNGVYSHQTGSMLGGHAIKIVGWGITPHTGTAYWIVQNSWNTHWGDLGGYFWIKKGTDECGIESNVVAGLPKIH